MVVRCRRVDWPSDGRREPSLGASGQISRSGSHTETFTADLSQANDSGASATADLSLEGNDLTVTLDGDGFFDGFPHAMHLHGEPGGDNVCGPLNPSDDGFADADADGDGFLSVIEGAASYGPVTVSLTTEGDTSPDSGLAVERFTDSGTLGYERTVEVTDEVAANLSSLHIVVHATDLNGDNEIGAVQDAEGNDIPSSLSEDLPLEATAPAACGQIMTAGTAAGPDTGAGGTAPTTSTTTTAGGLLAGLVALGGIGAIAARRRGNTTT